MTLHLTAVLWYRHYASKIDRWVLSHYPMVWGGMYAFVFLLGLNLIWSV